MEPTKQPLRDRWIIIGAGSAGCVLANRLSANPSRQVTLFDEGPGLVPGIVPLGISGPNFFAALEEPGRTYPELMATRSTGGEPSVYPRGRGIGGSSAVNAMVALRGNPDLYASWGWQDTEAGWDRVLLPTTLADPTELGAVDRALLQADERAQQVELTRHNRERVTSAQAYLWPILARPNLSVRADSLVERIVFDGQRARGVLLADGSIVPSDRVVVAAGAIHSPVLLLRSGVTAPGVGHGLQDHPSAVFTLQLHDEVPHDSRGLVVGSALHAQIDNQQIQLLPLSNLGPEPERAGLGALMAALMTPLSHAGTVTIDTLGAPVIDFALLKEDRDLSALVGAVRLGLDILTRPAFTQIVRHVFIDDVGTSADSLVDDNAIAAWVSSSCGDYVHATSTCAMGTVVDSGFAVYGYHGLYVCDASVFPSIPDVNTHLPTTMVAERFCLQHA